MAREEMADVRTATTTAVGIYNLEVCTLAPGIPLSLHIRVRAASEEDARRRGQDIFDGLWEGMTVLRTGDHEHTNGESVRLYVDDVRLAEHCPIAFEGS